MALALPWLLTFPVLSLWPSGEGVGDGDDTDMDDTDAEEPEMLCSTRGLSHVFWRLDGLPGIGKSSAILNNIFYENYCEKACTSLLEHQASISQLKT